MQTLNETNKYYCVNCNSPLHECYDTNEYFEINKTKRKVVVFMFSVVIWVRLVILFTCKTEKNSEKFRIKLI